MMLFDPAGVVWYRGAYVFSTKISQLRRSINIHIIPAGKRFCFLATLEMTGVLCG